MVVAGALSRADGCWLMHRRPAEKHHGGLWEFPGGKVEPFESPTLALVRELGEELGIGFSTEDCHPAVFAQGEGAAIDQGIVILLYMLRRWTGEPAALEGGEIGWFTPEQVFRLAKPPLDDALAARLFANC